MSNKRLINNKICKINKYKINNKILFVLVFKYPTSIKLNHATETIDKMDSLALLAKIALIAIFTVFVWNRDIVIHSLTGNTLSS